MHPRRSAQNVPLCDMCQTAPLQCHCKLCRIDLCAACVVIHLSDLSKRHNVVPFTQKKSTPECAKHDDKHCELYCEKCDIPVCSICVSGQHRGHILCDLQKTLGSKTQALQNDLEELESRICPRYEEMASDVQTEKAGLRTNYEKLTRDADQQGEILHREVTAIVNQRKSDIKEMKTKHMGALDQSIDEITHSITELQQMIVNLKAILKSNNFSLISSYKSRNNEFRRLPPKVRVTLPSFSPQKIHTEQLHEMFGSLSSISINTEEHWGTMTLPDPPVKPLIDELQFTATINTGYTPRSVSCLSEEQVWTCGWNNTMDLFNLQSELLTSIKHKLRNNPQDITVTGDRDLVYTDRGNNTINLVKNKERRTMITLQGWSPHGVCCTASDELLVTMFNDGWWKNQSKVVRYSGSTATQTIQYDDQGRPLYSSGNGDKYISENRNLDICVSDPSAKAIVVVNHSGKLRFRYTGHPSNTGGPFRPYGITTDSQGHILTADCGNDRIHILDQDGQFLRYIHNLHTPTCLCVDSRDNLFVAEWDTAKVKRIQYLKAQS